MSNMYCDIFDSLQGYIKNVKYKNKFVFDTKHSLENIKFFHFTSKSNQKKKWERII